MRCKEISQRVLEKFQKATDLGLPIHDLDIRKYYPFFILIFSRWGIQVNKEILHPLVGFKASRSWLLKFKTKYGIVSRKINKFVTSKEKEDARKVHEEAIKFVEEVKKFVRENQILHIFNADQSGFHVNLIP